MRKLLIALLTAGAVASPSFAESDERPDREERQQAREERQQAREERRQVRSQSAEGAVKLRSTNREVELRSNDRPARLQIERADRGAVEAARVARRQNFEAERDLRSVQRQELREERRLNRELRQSERAVPPVFRNRVPVVSSTPREGTQPPLRTEARRSKPAHWSTNWRYDRRYDWSNWRKRNRWLFHLGFYSDPFGWGYRPYSIGWRLWPSYYSRSYWLHDPWMYRLPYAPPGYRWIRYYEDAILVDTWTGEVVDVIYNFFW